MSGHYPFRRLTKGFSAKRHRRIDDMKKKLLAEMTNGDDANTHYPQGGKTEDEPAA